MAAQVIAAGEADPARVAAACLGPNPDGKSLWYQKHMTLHMIPAFDRGFLRGLTNAFLIRHPARVVASYSKKRESPTLMDIGFVQQAQLFDQVAELLGHAPPVIDSATIRANHGNLWKIFAENWASRSPKRCCTGPRDPSSMTASGRRTGTTPSTPAPASTTRRPPAHAVCGIPVLGGSGPSVL